MEAGKAKEKLHWLAEKLSFRGPRPRCRWSKLALLPMAATGSGGPPPRPPPSRRQDTWGVMAGYIDTYTGVGGWGKIAAKIRGEMLSSRCSRGRWQRRQRMSTFPQLAAGELVSAGSGAIEH